MGASGVQLVCTLMTLTLKKVFKAEEGKTEIKVETFVGRGKRMCPDCKHIT